MATLDFKGKALLQNYHLTVKHHELMPKRDESLTNKVRLDDNLIIHGDKPSAFARLRRSRRDAGAAARQNIFHRKWAQ